MTILLIRHGESEADILNVHEGRADFELTDRGHKQAQAMAEYVAKSYSVNKIFASTLKRANQTAIHLSQATGVEIIPVEDLMEFDNGLLAGLSFEEADRLYPQIKDLPKDQSVYGQESMVDFRARAERALSRILKESTDNETIAIVSHGGMINQLYGVMMRIPVEDYGERSFFCTGDTGIHEWRIKNNLRYVVKANYTEHTLGI